jgi:hypothetical protein
MGNFQAPMNLPPTPADVIDEIDAKIKAVRHRAARVMDLPVKGPRGQRLSVTAAQDRGQKLAEAIDTEEPTAANATAASPPWSRPSSCSLSQWSTFRSWSGSLVRCATSTGATRSDSRW